MKRIHSFIIPIILSGLGGTITAFADNPHEISPQSPTGECSSCHIDKPATTDTQGLLSSKNHSVDPVAFKQDGVEMCSSCHDKEDGHKVGIKLDFDTPADMPLGAKNKMTCLTCHYTHGSLNSKKPQASVSLMDRMLNAERLHKSFLLRRNNADGELCLTCHEVKEGAK